MAARYRTPEEEQEELRKRKEQLRDTFPPANGVEEWFLERLAVEALTKERCEHHESALRCHLAGRSEVMWDEDRRLAVLDLAAKLAGDPERIAARLRATSHGCDWLIEGWGHLTFVLERLGGWEERHRQRAMDLIGLPAAARTGDPLGLKTATVAELAAIASAQVAALEALKAESLDMLDAAQRELAALGQFVDVPKALARVLREKADTDRRINWLWAQLRSMRPDLSPPRSRPGLSLPENDNI